MIFKLIPSPVVLFLAVKSSITTDLTLKKKKKRLLLKSFGQVNSSNPKRAIGQAALGGPWFQLTYKVYTLETVNIFPFCNSAHWAPL